jgi:hypothetical protein
LFLFLLPQTLSVFEVSAAFDTTIPFADQLANKLPPAVNQTPISLSRDMEKTLSSDPSQLKGGQQALNSNVSSIHGPQGCDKSFDRVFWSWI